MAEKRSDPDLGDGVAASDLAEGGVLAGCFDGETLVLVRRDGRVCALGGTCTHLQAPLGEGALIDGALVCPWHHARFSIETGEAIGAPAFDPLPRYDVEERDGRVRVTGRRAPAPASPDARDPGRVVIVGGGAAGHACAELLVRHGRGGRVTIVSDDPDPPYDRTMCSKQYLIGQIDRADCMLAGQGFYGGPDGPALRNARAIGLDAAARVLRLDDGGALPFDALVIATGAEPLRPDTHGFDRADVHLLRTLADADRLIAASAGAKRVAIVGASFIGLEAAASLRQRELEVDVVAPDAVPLGKLLGPEIGGMIAGVHRERGVRFHLGRTVQSWDGTALILDDGSTVPADLVVLGVGVTPRTAVARDAGLTVADETDGGGIVVDARLESDVPGIFAAGDVARYPDARLGRPLRIEHWVHAQRQGQHVARVLLGLADAYADTPFFWSAHFDTGLRYVGHAPAGAEPEIAGSVGERNFTAHYAADGRDAAVVTCNRDADALSAEADFAR